MAVSPLPREPLRFERLARKKVWGGRKLAGRLGLDCAGPVGETWELSDYPGAETTVREGPCAGWTLRSLMEQHGGFLLGRSKPTRDGRFPLLVKFIDAAADLSVQIHPPDGPLSPTGVGKTEAWYVLEAEDGAEVICGLAPGTRRQVFEAEAGDSRVRRHLHAVPVRAGDFVFVPAGQTHAIRAGVVLCEIQQTSDVTFRMYDWDRPGLDGQPRPVHLREALSVVDYTHGPGRALRPDFPPATEGASVASLVTCPYFHVQLVRVEGSARHAAGGLARVLAVVGGSGELQAPGAPSRPIHFGDVFLLPGGLEEEVEVFPHAEGLEILEGIAR